MGASVNMDDERRRQAKAEADSLIQAGKITSDEDLDAFMSSKGIAPVAPADGTAGQNPANFQDFGAKYSGARAMKPGEGVVRNMARGATFGVSDRALAAITAGLDPKTDYNTARTRIDNENKRYEAESPAMALASNLVGGGFKSAPANMLARGATRAAGAMIPGAGTMSQMARLGGTSAILGAAGGVGYQDGEADKSREQTIQNALFGAKTGGAIGAAIPAAVRLGSTAADLTGLRRMGTPLPKNTVPTLPGAAPTPAFRDDPIGFLTGKAKNAVTSQEGVMYPTPAGRRVDQRMMNLLTGNGASTLDEASTAYQSLNDLTGDAMLLDVGGDAMNRANRGARTVGKGASATFNEALGARRANLSGQMEDDVANAIGGRENVPRGIEARRDIRSANARPAYAAVQDETVNLSPEAIGTLTEDPEQLWQKAWEAGAVTAKREMPSRSMTPLFGLVDDGQGSTRLGLTRQPTIGDIDTMKKGLNKVVSDRSNSAVSGARYDASLLSKRLDAMLEEVDGQVPAYGAARKQFGDDSEVLGAFKAGAEGIDDPFMKIPKFSEASPDQVDDFVSRLSDAGKQEYKLGLGQDMYRMVDKNAKSTLDKVASPNKSDLRKKIGSAFADTPEQGEQLISTWNARDKQGKNANFIEGGSPTADKLIDQIEAADATQQVGQLTYAPIRYMTGKAAQRAVTGLSKNLADELATRSTLGGKMGEDYFQYLDAYRKSLQAKAAGRASRTSRAIGTGTGMRHSLAALFGFDTPEL